MHAELEFTGCEPYSVCLLGMRIRMKALLPARFSNLLTVLEWRQPLGKNKL
jgi:hypothetical protein